MKKDHSIIYKDRSLKNWPHRQRLKQIKSVIQSESLADVEGLRYADVGCGTAYLTDIVGSMLQTSEIMGLDHSEHLEVAREKYPEYRFEFFELNEPTDVGKFDFVTCFETLEHVGNPIQGVDNLINTTSPGGTLLITLPIEIGPVGLIKFLAKTLVYGYKLDELSGEDTRLYNKYLFSLITYRDMSVFRDERFGWGTHFGFDYRGIDNYLKSLGVPFRAKNVVTTRFYVIKP